MNKIMVSLFIIYFFSGFLSMKAQTDHLKHEFSEAIEDNSFLIEEAYNQEPRVVQHINNLSYFTKPQKDLFYTLTQEWPLSGYKNQFSYCIPYSFLNSNEVHGIGDIMINYRYQLFYTEDWACVAPRLTLILPTGNSDEGLGKDVFGFQFNFPVSKRMSDAFALHFNAGFTFLPNVKGNNTSKNITTYLVGGSLIYLMTENFNFMLEGLSTSSGDFNENDKVVYTNSTIINPGFRFALNFKKLQVVPGFSVPISITGGETTASAFFYLSFEHPF
jgi:hypothetical protein